MKETILILDNGSLRPAPSLALQELAAKVSERTGREVEPVSVLHSHKVDPALIGGRRARIARPYLSEAVKNGARSFVCLPLFLGPSLAVTEYLPKIFADLRQDAPDLRFTIAHPLAGADPEAPDARLTEVLAERVGAVIAEERLQRPAVALVDHGTPLRVINTIREAVAAQLRDRLGSQVSAVRGCSMERKPEPEFAFNEPLLEGIRSVEGFRTGPLVVAMFFLLSGRHAGPNGDVAEICRAVEAEYPESGQLHPTGLIGQHSKVVDILADRLEAALLEGHAPACPRTSRR